MQSSFPAVPEGFEDIAKELVNAKSDRAKELFDLLNKSAEEGGPALADGRIVTKDPPRNCFI